MGSVIEKKEGQTAGDIYRRLVLRCMVQNFGSARRFGGGGVVKDGGRVLKRRWTKVSETT